MRIESWEIHFPLVEIRSRDLYFIKFILYNRIKRSDPDGFLSSRNRFYSPPPTVDARFRRANDKTSFCIVYKMFCRGTSFFISLLGNSPTYYLVKELAARVDQSVQLTRKILICISMVTRLIFQRLITLNHNRCLSTNSK